jgi:uncharacterized protein YbdZ (MbtH family)
MPDIYPPKTPPFQINKPVDGQAIALLPTLGTKAASILDMQFPITGVDEYHTALHAAIGDLKKAYESGIVEAAKALGATPPQAMSYARLSFMPDPANAGLMQWPGMQPESLRKVAREQLLPQMVIRSRVTDLRRYSCLSTHAPYPAGWRITMRDAKKTPSRDDLKDIRDAERFIWNCSREQAYSDPEKRDSHHISQFESFLCAMADDTFTFDGWAMWKDRDNAGRVRSFANLPAGLVRLALPDKGYKGDPSLYAALVDDTGTPFAAFSRDTMTWCVRNERNDPNVVGYGWAETEMAIRVIQGFGGAIDLNVNAFDRNSIPNGMMVLTGDFWQQDQIDALQREWTNMKRGLSKMWGMPVVAVPEEGSIDLLNFMDMKGEEVRYKDHMNLMTGVYCAIMQFPIKRFGMFASGNHRDNQPVQDGSVELQGVDDPGLPALLTFIEHRVNEYLLHPNWDHLSFKFEAKNPKDDARAFVERTKARTWKESRAEADLPSLESIAPPELKDFAKLMSLCPEDASKVGAFQSMAVTQLEKMLGIVEEGGDDVKEPGAPTTSPKDPARSQAHGHRAGVPRSAATVRNGAAQSEGATA